MTVVTIHQPCCCEQLGTQLDAGALYELANKIGMAALEMDRSLKAGEAECAQRAVGSMRQSSNVMNAIAAHLENKLATHRRRTTGVR